MLNPIISVIIPVYGVEQYIEQCLFSLFSNSISKKCEFIIVNDCTKDSSMEVAKNVMRKFPTLAQNVLIVEHKQNKGLAGARNSGLKKAKGEYIITVDSDDWVEMNFLEELYIKIKLDDSDICSCDYFAESCNGVSKIVQKNFFTNPITNINLLVRKNSTRCIWTNLVKRSLFDTGIVWQEGIDLGEDLLINLKLLLSAKKVSYIPTPLYHYRLGNAQSITHRGEKKIEKLVMLERACSTVLDEAGFDELALVLRKDIKKSILACSLKSNRSEYYSLWPETKKISDFYAHSLGVFFFFFFMRLRLFILCDLMIDIHSC